jgi:hypothetical protein
MTTKEWLSRARYIDEEINALMRERRKAFDRCVSITSRLNATTVTGTRDPHKYDALVIYEEAIDKKLDELYRARREIYDAILSVPDGAMREVLRRRYIDKQSFDRIAREMRYGKRHIFKLLAAGTRELENVWT